MPKEKLTPMMEQYWDFKKSLNKDTLLLFRLGDFYEMFFDDAVCGSKILGITLTKRQSSPMAGIPYHALQQYLPKLLEKGKKVAICEQDEKPVAGKLVKRSISRILTPGTSIDDYQLSAKQRNYMYAVDIDVKKRRLFASWIDVSTGEFLTAQFENPEDFIPVFSANSPKEILLPEVRSKEWKSNPSLSGWLCIFRAVADLCPITLLPDYVFDREYGFEQTTRALSRISLDGFGIKREFEPLGTAGALIFYSAETLRHSPVNLRSIKKYDSGKYMSIDAATQRNLELFKTVSGSRNGSVLSLIDYTQSAAGGRLLESYLASPLMDLDEIRLRGQTAKELFDSPAICEKLLKSLGQVKDLPRILGRLKNGVKNPRELGAVASTLDEIEPIKELLKSVDGTLCKALAENIGTFAELKERLKNALNDELPIKIAEGGVIRSGFNQELDDTRNLSVNSKKWLSDFEANEQAQTGIKNLRVKHTAPFGFSIEVTKSFLHLVPAHYIRRQTLVNAERFTTDELRKKETEILNSEEKALQLEQKIFDELVDYVLESFDPLIDTAETLAKVDVFCSYAKLALDWDYCLPKVDNSDTLDIVQGRHVVIEQMLANGKTGLSDKFVPNDTFLSSSGEQIALITGPNMAGKSTYIRQTALIAILAQMGCFVPAKECTMGLIDKVFSRVGASDELSRGNSTFMVEMNETANILNNATNKSLIILDEIGRGTSTYDGLSIAWAIVEYLHGDEKSGPKTLFATHYHELTKLEGLLNRLVNYKVCVREYNDEIIFVRTIERGQADKSYGIQVAKLAGLPNEVIERAKSVLSEIENEGNIVVCRLDSAKGATPKPRRERKKDAKGGATQLFFL